MKTIEKELKNFNFPEILIDLHRNRKTGTLTVDTGEVTKRVFLDKGKAVFASSTDEDDRLGETLIKLGKITIDQYERSVELLKETGKRQGTILVELGYLTPKDLVLGVKSQVREIIYSLFDVEYAEYEFDEGQLPKREVITLQMSMGDLIYEGTKRINNVVRIKRDIPDMNMVLRLKEETENILQDIALSHKDQTMLSLIDGKKTVKELVDTSPNGTFEAMKILYVLCIAGIVEVQEKRESSVEKIGEEVEFAESSKTEEETFEDRVNQLFSNLYEQRAHDLLGITKASDAKTVQSSYYRLIKEYHPDKYISSTDPLMLDKLITISEAIQNAYVLLKEDGQRREYFQSISATPENVSEDDVDEQFRSELSKVSEAIFPEIDLSEKQKIEDNGDSERKHDRGSDGSVAYSYCSEMEHLNGTDPEMNQDLFITREDSDAALNDQSEDSERIYDIAYDDLQSDDMTSEEKVESIVTAMNDRITDPIPIESMEDSLSVPIESNVETTGMDYTSAIGELPNLPTEEVSEESVLESVNEGDYKDNADSSILSTLQEPDGFAEKRRYDEYESIFTSPDNPSDNHTFKSDVCATTQKNMSEADMTAKTEVIEDDDKGAQVSTARDEINQQLVDLIGEIKVLLTDIRAGLPVAAAHNVSTEQEPAVRSETKTTNSTVSDNSSYLKDDLAEHLNEVSQEELETIPKVVKEYLDEAEQVIEREENRIEPQKTEPPKKKLKLWHIIIPVLFLVAATASFLFIYAPERQKAVPQPVQAKKEMMPAVQKTPETRPVAAPEVNKSAVAAAPMIAGQHTVELIASESTWLSATIDEKSSKEMMLKAGDKVRWTAKNNVSLIIGNAAGLKVIFDGKEISPMGGKGKVARLRLP